MEKYHISCNDNIVEKLRKKVKSNGFANLPDAISDDLAVELRREAAIQRANSLAVSSTADICYKAHLADLGDAARSFLNSSSLSNFLSQVFRESLEMTPSASCYTYYEPGDFLNAHRDDASACTATVITYLDVTGPVPGSDDTGLILRIYNETGPDVDPIKTSLPTRALSMIVGYGSRYWHERPELKIGESLTALTACFSKVPG